MTLICYFLPTSVLEYKICGRICDRKMSTITPKLLPYSTDIRCIATYD